MTANHPKPQTVLTHTGRRPSEQHGFVNTPVTRGSTVLYSNLDAFENREQEFHYGRTGNPSTKAVEELISELEGAKGTVLTPSGLSAISLALLSCVKSGDHILVTDSAYEPTRNFCNSVLTRMGVETTYYDPLIGAGIESLIQPNTRVIFTESPGSITFEIQDIPAISKVAHQNDISVIIDNSWATPLFLKPLELGADIVVHAGTKMFVGHSDAMFGTVSANEKHWESLHQTHYYIGICASPDDSFLAARGLRTLSLRMKEHETRALEIANWLHEHEAVTQVLHPALPSHPNHDIFKRDFSGSGCVFSFMLPKAPHASLRAFIDGLEIFGVGYSWGGFESLVLPAKPQNNRTATNWTREDQVLRLHIGFEDMSDIKADIAAAIARYVAHM